jgi:hypothetical protein
MVTIKGATGTGKSALAEELPDPVEKASGFFCTGTYEADRNEPYTGVSASSKKLPQIMSETWRPPT